MDKRVLQALVNGDVDQLLAWHKQQFGDTVMTADPAAAAPPAPPAPPADTIRVPAAPPAPPAPAPTSTFTAEDIERARQQEKEKLYPELQKLREQQEQQQQLLATFQAEREEREAAALAAQQAAEAAAEEKRLAELSYAEKLQEFQKQQEEKFQSLEQQLAARDAIIEKERQFTELMQYRSQALSNEDPNGPGGGQGPNILPELRDLVTGNTREEIDASVSALAQRSASILQQVASATQAARQGARGVGVTAPPVGPMDNNSGYETVTRDDIANMDMATYAQNRGRLLGAAAQQHRDRGMFG